MNSHITIYKNYFLLLLLLLAAPLYSKAQKNIQEGIIRYTVSIENTDATGTNKSMTGTYTITFKGAMTRKEIKINNGYTDILVMDNNNHSLYSIKTRGEKKYAIQLDESDYLDKHKKFEGFTLADIDAGPVTMAGLDAKKTKVSYTDGTQTEIYYATDTKWQPSNKWTFERLPDIQYLPLTYSYKENNTTITLKIEKVESVPIETSTFKIPHHYKIISYAEYQQMTH